MTCKNCGFKSCRCYESSDLDSGGEDIYISYSDEDSQSIYSSSDDSSDEDYVYNSSDDDDSN